MMKKHIKIILASLICAMASFCCHNLAAQTVTETIPEGYELADSVVFIPVSAIDTTLAGKDIFRIMPSKAAGDDSEVVINQSSLVSGSMDEQIRSNGERTLTGYRVRIFFDNKQSARNESEATLKRFNTLFPDVMAYRIYVNPYFKVTVGDFRTKSEAMSLLSRIKGAFPSAFVVKENIAYPVVDTENAVYADTIKVLRPIVKK